MLTKNTFAFLNFSIFGGKINKKYKFDPTSLARVVHVSIAVGVGVAVQPCHVHPINDNRTTAVLRLFYQYKQSPLLRIVPLLVIPLALVAYHTCDQTDFRKRFVHPGKPAVTQFKQWSNSIYDRGCARAIPDHVIKVTDRESAKISNRIQSVTTVIDCFFDTRMRIPPI